MAFSNPSVTSSFSHAAQDQGKIRPSAHFHPSVWGNHFMTLSRDQQKIDAWAARASELKEEVRAMLKEYTKGSEQEIMELIDNLQRLGVGYLFEKEIEEALKLMYHSNNCLSSETDPDMHLTALRFRLLRQRGYRVNSGKFNEILTTTDPNGMLSLYEAAFLGTHGEAILDDALAFSRKHLQLAVGHLEPPLEAMVKNALELPLCRRIHRVETRHYISLKEMKEGHSADKLLELAKLDYNLLQNSYLKDLQEISRWWKELNLAEKLSFARDRIVECYLWIVAVLPEPKYFRARIQATKLIGLITVIDDIYDAYGTFDELQLFTDAIQRWNLSAMDQLPDYLKFCYLPLLDCIKAIEEDLAPQRNSRRVYYLVEAMKRLCREYLVEARWFNQGYTPTLDEYLRCSTISCVYPVIITLCYIGMGDEVPEELFTWLESDPKIVDATCLVCRLIDDIASNEFEQKRGHVASAVQCYMKEHDSSKEEACQKLREMVDFAWKDINGACLEPAPFPVPLLHRILNLSHVMEDLYLFGDGFTFSNTYTKEKIADMFVNAIPV